MEDDDVEIDATAEALELEDCSIPLQKPFTQVLKAHCESEVHPAWKLPQVGTCIAFTA